jgi:hypothetical protein
MMWRKATGHEYVLPLMRIVVTIASGFVSTSRRLYNRLAAGDGGALNNEVAIANPIGQRNSYERNNIHNHAGGAG